MPKTDNIQQPLSIRAILTGMSLGSLLVLCNLYMALRIGWSMNMSILATLLGFVSWKTVETSIGCRAWSPRETSIQQTTASAAAGTVSAGLVAPIPAYLILTDSPFEYWPMVFWMIAISLLGICVASAIRPAMLSNTRLRFPAGIATAEVITDMFSSGRIARQRIIALLSAMIIAISHRIFIPVSYKLPLSFSIPGQGEMAGSSISVKNLGFIIDPSYMLLAFGTIIGTRAAISLFIGCLIAWLGLGPYILGQGWEQAGPIDSSWFTYIIDWLVWPGVAMMLASAITTTAITLFKSDKKGRLSLMWGWQEFLLLGTLTPVIVILQVNLFDISWFAAILAVPLAFIFAIVAAQVVGETGIPPIGALGKLSQLSFSVISPGSVTTNLMTANVAGGAAGQATDLLNDFKAGHILGTNPRHQVFAQTMGIIVGCLSSAAIFMLLIPNPAEQLMTEQWPAPGVATWKIIAIALTEGLDAIPQSARYAMFIGIVAATINELLPLIVQDKWHRYLPSMSAMGLAFVLPAQISIMLFIGAVLAWFLRLLAPKWSQRFLLAIAAGCIAGESIAGVFGSIFSLLF
ncbi:OPT/YSL family transporter [Shewanella sp. D64]|uniref:OPT/YSL family transporter n=1 Tax=unclassified Shewanella TaxID=196818 RepID=UPI0022BA1C95|nr:MULTISPECIES: OPT family oligopeptide transporter [unclassified Shewanella]MEC4726820.1 OPT/YSL family transporter [Shewanella sp. D64]MEC4739068.1 OPT/YSL family transporter [Shewanella sp. E94]WBJ95924.1 OPT/YSL family transporter [Shewanella sp. MTB7]